MTNGAGGRYIILSFTDVAKSYSVSGNKFMIADAYGTIFTLRDISTGMANDPSCIAFFVDEDSNFFALSEIFLDTITRQLGKVRSNLLAHIDQKDTLFEGRGSRRKGRGYVVVKTFIIHSIYLRIKKRE